MRKNKSFIAVSAVLFAPLLCTAGVWYAPDGHTKETDSIKKQQRIYEKLDLISEAAIPLLEESSRLPALPEFTPPTVEGRLRKLSSMIPLDYNEQVQGYIDRYSTDRYRNYLSRMMGLGQYYFKIYDQVFEETGLPAEIKYLSVVESALDPNAVSRVGATGPWQFMFATAKVYGLQMDSYIDERKDPVAASYAAARYLLEAHRQFGDWLLAIAAYNCGPGNVQRAIKRSGLENPDYWAISRFLPKETRNYVPAFIAMTYMMEYHTEYGIAPAETDLDVVTEMVNVQQAVPFSALSKALGVEEGFLKLLNPAYKRGLVNGSPDAPKRLVLPAVAPGNFETLYAVLNEKPAPGSPAAVVSSYAETKMHVVKKGDTLSGIASKHKGATVSSIKLANGLKNNNLHPGMKLRIQ